MIDVTKAVKLARQYANELYQDEKVENLGLEEVIFDDDSKEWRVTLGYDSHRVRIIETAPNRNLAFNMLTPSNIEKETLREYKTFRINGEDGELKGMLMREVG